MDVRIYQTETGKSPYQDWLHQLKDVRARAVINARLDRLEVGCFGEHRYLREGLCELKIDFGPGYRVYFSEIRKGMLILLVMGGAKKTQNADIEKAVQFLADFKKRYKS